MVSRMTWRRSRKDSIRGGPSLSIKSDRSETEVIEMHFRKTVWSLAFLADGRYIAGGGHEGMVRRWETKDGREVGMPMSVGDSVLNIAVSLDARLIVSGTDSGWLTVWNAVTHEKVAEFKAHARAVHAIDLSPVSPRVATGSNDRTVCVWSITTGKQLLGPLQHNNYLAAVKYSPRGRLLATATWVSNSIRIYHAQDGHILHDIPINVNSSVNQSLVWSADDGQLFALSLEGKIHCLDTSSGVTLSQWPIHSNNNPRCISLASNGTYIAASANSSVSFWDTTTHKQIGGVIDCAGVVRSMDISPDNTHLASGGDDQKIVTRNLRNNLPECYFVDTRLHQRNRTIIYMADKIGELEETIESLRADLCAQKENSKNEIASLTETTRELQSRLFASQHASQRLENEQTKLSHLLDKIRESARQTKVAFDDLMIKHNTGLNQAQDSNMTINSLRAVLTAHEQKHQCETLYAEGHFKAAADAFLEIVDTKSDEVKANKLITDWISEFKQRCITTLETVGDSASSSGDYDEAISAYSAALHLKPPTLHTLFTKWTRSALKNASANEVLSAASEIPKFTEYQTICDILEQTGRIMEAIDHFRRMINRLSDDDTVKEAQIRWKLGFQQRCAEKLVNLGDATMESQNYIEAVERYSNALSLNPKNIYDVLIKRSRARALMGLWVEALVDADEAIQLDPSSHWGYERRHAALHGARRYPEAAESFKTMLWKIDQASDSNTRDLRNQYVDAEAAIQNITKQVIRNSPRVLIDTTTGHLLDKSQQAAAFEPLPVYHELVSSMTTQLEYARIWREVKGYYQYVMLSHKWEPNEPLLQKVENISIYELEASPTNTKLQRFCFLARSLGFMWAWSDTCCVDRTNNVVLQESLVAMFMWYRGSSLTVIYLRGVSSPSKPGDLRKSIWNTRAWTFQEYVASNVVQFYIEDWTPYLGLEMFNHRDSPAVISEMEQATGVSAQELGALRPGLDRVREKLSLASMRQTTLEEDIAYSLFGIFNVAITAIYGEGNRAVGRLLEHILTGSGDVSMLAWTGNPGSYNSCLPSDLTVFNYHATTHIPPPIGDSDMNDMLADLRSTLCDPTLAMTLYGSLNELPAPFLVASRLKLSGIVFPLDKLVPTSETSINSDLWVYRATTSTLGDIKIKTTDDLSGMKDLVLIHPWISPLLDQEFSQAAAGLDKMTRALRFVIRLRQPFGALLLAPLSRVQYKRVATDSLIVVQVNKEASLMELIGNIRTIDIQ